MHPNGNQANSAASLLDAEPSPVGSGMADLLTGIALCSRDEKRTLLHHLLRELLGEKVERESGVYNADGTPYVFLVPPLLRHKLDLTPERLAELERSSKDPREGRPFSELVAKLQAMSKK